VNNRPNELFFLDNYQNIGVLGTTVAYGANNTGKSNLLKAIKALEWLVLNSDDLDVGDEITPNEFYALDISTLNKSTIFEIDFIAVDNLRYNYLVEVGKKKVIREELYFFPINESGRLKKRKLYVRENNTKVSFGEDLTGERKLIEKKHSMTINFFCLNPLKTIKNDYNPFIFFLKKKH
jgi:hypothetical protein